MRTACLKALPTDEEITAAGFTDAAAYMRWYCVEDEDGYMEMLATRGVQWETTRRSRRIAAWARHVHHHPPHRERDHDGQGLEPRAQRQRGAQVVERVKLVLAAVK